MAAFSQTTLSNAFSWMKILEFSIEISLKFVPKGLINNIPALVLIMAWRRPGDKPLSEPMLVRSLTHICVTRPQWVNGTEIPVINLKRSSDHLRFIMGILLPIGPYIQGTYLVITVPNGARPSAGTVIITRSDIFLSKFPYHYSTLNHGDPRYHSKRPVRCYRIWWHFFM